MDQLLQHHYGGWRPSPPDARDLRAAVDRTEYPREYDPRGETLPILDQAELGACTANATMRAIRYAFIAAGAADPGDLSRLWAYAQTRYLEGGRKQFDEDSGAFGRDDFKVARKIGLIPETDWDYSDYKESFNSWSKFVEAKHVPPAERHFIDEYSHPHPDPATFMAVLSSKKMIPFGFNVYESFESAQVAKTGIVPVPSSRERVLGGHEIAIEGYVYLQGKRYWLCPNNWSEGWGDKGYCYFPDELMFGYGTSDWRVVDSVKS